MKLRGLRRSDFTALARVLSGPGAEVVVRGRARRRLQRAGLVDFHDGSEQVPVLAKNGRFTQKLDPDGRRYRFVLKGPVRVSATVAGQLLFFRFRERGWRFARRAPRDALRPPEDHPVPS